MLRSLVAFLGTSIVFSGLIGAQVHISSSVDLNTSSSFVSGLSSSEREQLKSVLERELSAYNTQLADSINPGLASEPIAGMVFGSQYASAIMHASPGRDTFIYPQSFSGGLDYTMGFYSLDSEIGEFDSEGSEGFSGSVSASAGFSPGMVKPGRFLWMRTRDIHVVFGFASSRLPEFLSGGDEDVSSSMLYSRFNYRIHRPHESTWVSPVFLQPGGSSVSMGVFYSRTRRLVPVGNSSYVTYSQSLSGTDAIFSSAVSPQIDASGEAQAKIGSIADVITIPMDYSIDWLFFHFLHYSAGIGYDLSIGRSRLYADLGRSPNVQITENGESIASIEDYDVSLDDSMEKVRAMHGMRIFTGIGFKVYQFSIFTNYQLSYPGLANSVSLGTKLSF